MLTAIYDFVLGKLIPMCNKNVSGTEGGGGFCMKVFGLPKEETPLGNGANGYFRSIFCQRLCQVPREGLYSFVACLIRMTIDTR